MDQLLCQQRAHINSTCRCGANGLWNAPGWPNPSLVGGEEMPTRSTSSTLLSLLMGGFHVLSCSASATEQQPVQTYTPTRSIPGECNLYQAEDPYHPGEFRPEATWPSSFLYFSFSYLGPTWSLFTYRQNPSFGLQTPKPGNAPSQPRPSGRAIAAWSRSSSWRPHEARQPSARTDPVSPARPTDRWTSPSPRRSLEPGQQQGRPMKNPNKLQTKSWRRPWRSTSA
jgi:hypothetical protein